MNCGTGTRFYVRSCGRDGGNGGKLNERRRNSTPTLADAEAAEGMEILVAYCFV